LESIWKGKETLSLKGGWPSLACKGGDCALICRWLNCFLTDCLGDQPPAGTSVDVVLCHIYYQACVRFWDIMYAGQTVFLSEESRCASYEASCARPFSNSFYSEHLICVRQAGRTMLLSYQHLASRNHARKLFKIRPKTPGSQLGEHRSQLLKVPLPSQAQLVPHHLRSEGEPCQKFNQRNLLARGGHYRKDLPVNCPEARPKVDPAGFHKHVSSQAQIRAPQREELSVNLECGFL